MAVQFHIAFSNEVQGVGIFAGGPYFCALGDMTKALVNCMSSPMMINIDSIYTKITSFVDKEYIDPISNIKDDKVYIFSGKKDTTVMQAVDKKGEEMYKHFGAQVRTEYTLNAAHTQPTNDPSLGDCGKTASPYIAYCQYDGAYEALNFISAKSPLLQPISKVKSNLYSYKQTGSGSMAKTGYVYVPTGCQYKDDCDVHIAFHGCQQNPSKIGLKFVELAGYQEVAEANDIIVMFPQAESSMFSPMNPNGCWDWWGYGESSSFLSPAYKYATKLGYQMSQIHDHLAALQQGSLNLTPAVHSEFEQSVF